MIIIILLFLVTICGGAGIEIAAYRHKRRVERNYQEYKRAKRNATE